MDRHHRDKGRARTNASDATSPSTVDSLPPTRPPESEPAPGSVGAPTKSRESLLEQGVRLESSGQLEQAIHVWTKILFVDRGNVRAKRAIQKAKRSIAERQRELDAEVSLAQAEIERGERSSALARLHHVLRLDPRHQEARLIVETLEARDRREPSADELPFGSDPARLPSEMDAFETNARVKVPAHPSPGATNLREPSPAKMVMFVVAALALFVSAGAYLYANWEFLFYDEGFNGPAAPADPTMFGLTLPLPARSDLRYYNGVRLFHKGRYREALSELAKVEVGSSNGESARSLILRIEDRLLRDNPAPTEPAAPSGGS